MRNIIPLLAFASFLLLLGQSRPLKAYALEGQIWPNGDIPMNLQLNSGIVYPTGGTFTDGSPSFNQVAVDALNDWNPYLNNVQFTANFTTLVPASPDGINSVFFASNVFGESFGSDAIAITERWTNQAATITTEADVVVNTAYQWNSYRGNLQTFGQDYVYDLRRTLDHEFGHVLGLDHPDLANPPQNVVAIMNSVIGNLDHIAQDDINGVLFLYGDVFASLYFQNGTQVGFLSVNTSFAPTTWHGVGYLGNGWTERAIADINGDGTPDILCQNGTTIGVWLMGPGQVPASFVVIGGMGAGWQMLGAASLDGSGEPNLIFQNGTLLGYLTINTAAQPVSWHGIGGMNTGWELRSVADLNADDQPDLIFQNGTLLGALQVGTNGLPVAWHGIGAMSSGWILGYATDINSDGQPDLVFQNNGLLGALEVNTSFLPVAWHGIGSIPGWYLPGDFY